jgi:hypothetical protein
MQENNQKVNKTLERTRERKTSSVYVLSKGYPVFQPM